MPYQASRVAMRVACWLALSDSANVLTSTLAVELYNNVYSKKAVVEASTPHSLCTTLFVFSTALYSALQRCRALQLYSSSTVYNLYTIPV